MTQLSLDLDLPARYGRYDFLVSPSNAAAFTTIQRWPDWPGRVLLLVGPPGAGKTHLAHVWAAEAKAVFVKPDGIEALSRADGAGAGVIDGADALESPEAAVFHFLNVMREAGSSVLITARSPPDLWGLATLDLLSRLRLAPMVRLEPPDDALMRAVLVKLFDDRQIRIDAPLIDYLARHLDRSLAAVGDAVRRLDQAGLSSGRRITRATAAALLSDQPLDAE